MGDTNLINKEIDIYRSLTRQDLQNAAKKYLNSNQRVIINYVPEKNNSKNRYKIIDFNTLSIVKKNY